MQTKVEGIILSKTPFQDRHLIVHLLLRSGKKISVLFFGGRGGGKKQKSSILELGFLISVELAHTQKNVDVYHAKEWILKWSHDHIRNQFYAFSLMCFYLEAIAKLSPQEHLHEVHFENKEMEGLFITLSNALFYLEKTLKEKKFNESSPIGQMIIFLGKLLIHLGVYPEREKCLFCTEDLQQKLEMFIVPEEGGFSCAVCLDKREKPTKINYGAGRELWEVLGHVAHTKYSEISIDHIENKWINKIILNYMCYQFHLSETDFKTISVF